MAAPVDYRTMGCEQWREVLSAQLDGEEQPAERAALDAHLDGCAGCRRWLDQAAAVTRRTRTRLVGDVPDLTALILAGAPQPAPTRRRSIGARLVPVLRALLGLVGTIQLVLGLAQIGRGSAADHVHSSGDPSGAGHLWHESAAWNVAVGAGFLFIALRRSRPTGLLPTLSAFVATLLLLSVNDLITARVDPTRLVSHGFLLAGYLIIVALSRPRHRPDEPEADGGRGEPRWRASFDQPPVPAGPVPGLRLVPPPATARLAAPVVHAAAPAALRDIQPAASRQPAADRGHPAAARRLPDVRSGDPRHRAARTGRRSAA